jgi:hypothetical protein
MSTAERSSPLLLRMLDRVGLVPSRSEVAEDGRVRFVVPNPNESPIEKLDVSMAADSDVEVALHVPGRRGSPTGGFTPIERSAWVRDSSPR